MDEKDLRTKILELVKQFHAEKKKAAFTPFIPEKSKIPYAGRVYDERELVSLVDSSLDFWLTAGRFASDFEKRFASWWGTKFCSLANSGSSANLLALSALTAKSLGEKRLNKGDEVITTASSFPTTVNPIFQNGLVPVFLDTEVGTYNMDCSRLEEAVSNKTKAVFVAHTLGNPFNLDAVTKFCKKHGLYLIEDCCDAAGAEYAEKKVGLFGDITTCSFYPAHHITLGEGGAVLTSNPILKKLIESFRDWGRDCWCASGKDDTCGKRFSWKLGELPLGYDHKYIYSNIGYNLHVTDMQAAVGVAQLEKLDAFIKARRENHEFYLRRMKELEEYFVLPQKLPKANPSPFGFVLTVKEGAGFTRNDIVQHLESKGIATRMVFGGNITRQPAYLGENFRVVGELIGADQIMNHTFWFGVYPGLTKEMREYVVREIDSFVKTRRGSQ